MLCVPEFLVVDNDIGFGSRMTLKYLRMTFMGWFFESKDDIFLFLFACMDFLGPLPIDDLIWSQKDSHESYNDFN